MALDARTPVLVGVGQLNQRTDRPEDALEPVALMVEAARAGRDLPVVVSLCGTSADPQDGDRQASALQAAGAAVFFSNAAATRHAVALIQGGQG